MSNEEIKTLIEQEANKYADQFYGPKVLSIDTRKYEAFKAGAAFYEQSILPEVLKEKDRIVLEWMDKAADYQGRWRDLQSQLSQLQSKMEEEKRKAFEAAREYYWKDDLEFFTHETYEDYLKSSTQSTESGNLNKQ